MSIIRDFYLARADENARDAAATPLENVRDRCLRSEAAWRSMADRLMRGEEMRETLARDKEQRGGPMA